MYSIVKSFKQKLGGKAKKAFTLVEVMLAVGVIAVSLTALVGLLGAITASVTQIKRQSKALSLVQNVEAYLKSKTFEDVYSWVEHPTNPYVIYFWDEYTNPEDLDNTALVMCSSEDTGRTPNTPPDSDELRNRVAGDIYRVVLTVNGEMLEGRFIDAANIDTAASGYQVGSNLPIVENYAEAYLPIRCEIMIDPRTDILDKSATEAQNDQRRVAESTIMKLR
ncbi:MAG: type II secretion system protein [Opitutales bacterium]|nr:type II secretion system protein [Opitutales bacterium]